MNMFYGKGFYSCHQGDDLILSHWVQSNHTVPKDREPSKSEVREMRQQEKSEISKAQEGLDALLLEGQHGKHDKECRQHLGAKEVRLTAGEKIETSVSTITGTWNQLTT